MSKRLAVGAVIGMVVGVVAGVLTAPKSGRETREDLMKKANELKDVANDKTELAKEQAARRADDLKAVAEDLRVKGEKVVDDALESARRLGKKD